ncbi:hypothetical protein QS306_00980 [Paraburkholderia bonniea]|uniref:hypothetical protein n=1 Tax=Paraburkholderia bonniea TaxID=2152891 RepID=UPI002573F886|nr:hypothetical protein [Paraburkholderia bonniea]WJF90295.1 hypothetical protein QS306_00980 [Paraburkholderia bonniea]WJF93610.1 hypothetical protein QS308_00980 [Paraburkholderia bonniea]
MFTSGSLAIVPFVFEASRFRLVMSYSGPTSKLQQQFEAISLLPRARQRFVSEMLDTVLAQTPQ